MRDSILTDCRYLVTGVYHPLSTSGGEENYAEDTDSFVSPEFEDWMDTNTDHQSILNGLSGVMLSTSSYSNILMMVLWVNLLSLTHWK